MLYCILENQANLSSYMYLINLFCYTQHTVKLETLTSGNFDEFGESE